MDPPQIKHHRTPLSEEKRTGFGKTGGNQRVLFFFIIAITIAAMQISFGMFGGFTSFDQAHTVKVSIHSPAATAGAGDGMTALDRRMLKYFQSYFYVPPVPSDTLRQDFPGKELLTRKSLRDKICGAAPAFDEYFQLKLNERSANNEDKWIYENLFKGKRNESMGGVMCRGHLLRLAPSMGWTKAIPDSLRCA